MHQAPLAGPQHAYVKYVISSCLAQVLYPLIYAFMEAKADGNWFFSLKDINKPAILPDLLLAKHGRGFLSEDTPGAQKAKADRQHQRDQQG
jgi:hypothetical protein